MAKGKKKGAQTGPVESSGRNAGGGGLSNQRNMLAAKLEASLGDQLKPGRHGCSCQARIHKLVRNCMGCGKIVCEQEGSGPCFFCGTLVCTKEEREVLDRNSKKSAELYEKLMGVRGGGKVSLASIGRDLVAATQFRDKLLEADADSVRRNKVNDLESDYSSVESNPFLSSEERSEIVRRRDELMRIREQRRKAMVISLDLTNMTASEQKVDNRDTDPSRDPLIRAILERSDDRRRAAEALHSRAVDATWSPVGFVPKYAPQPDVDYRSNVHLFLDAELNTRLSEEQSRLETERQGFTVALPQPYAALIAHGKIRFFRWHDDISLKGPLFIASTSHTTTSKEVDAAAASCSDGKSKSSSTINSAILDYSAASLLGRVYVEDCIPIKDFQSEHGSIDPPGRGNFVVCLSASDPLAVAVPHIGPVSSSSSSDGEVYRLDPQLKQALASVFKD